MHLFEQLQTIRSHGQVNRIGVSVYNPEQLKNVALNYPIDIAQVPLNIFDQRFISTDVMHFCQKRNIKLHVRSLFLQGLLFLEQDKLDPFFKPYQKKLSAFTKLAKYLGCTKLTLALAIVAQELPISEVNQSIKQADIVEKIVVGVCSASQLVEIVNAYQKAKELILPIQDLLNLADNRIAFINPSLWELQAS
jgi:aryl-alcohol dehydrogenase-like predicted oxidoreductase